MNVMNVIVKLIEYSIPLKFQILEILKLNLMKKKYITSLKIKIHIFKNNCFYNLIQYPDTRKCEIQLLGYSILFQSSN